MRPFLRPSMAGLVGVLALCGCGTVAPASAPAATSSHNVHVSVTFAIIPGVAVTYDPALVGAGAHGAVDSMAGGGSTTVTLTVDGLEPDRRYGAHAHAKPCGATGKDAGPHFQNVVDPVQPSTDPQYANPENEIWLDLTTDASGAGTATTTVAWEFPTDRRAQSVIIHSMPTATEPGRAGTAGDRVACITVNF